MFIKSILCYQSSLDGFKGMIEDFGFKPIHAQAEDSNNTLVFIRCGDKMTEIAKITRNVEYGVAQLLIYKALGG